MSFQVGVDVGRTFTTAAVVRGGRAEVVSVVPTRLPGVPRGFPSRVGDDTPVLVGTRPVPAETLVAQLVAQVVSTVSTVGEPTRLAVTHPVTWGPHRVAALRAALGEVTMLSTAAAVAYRSDYPTAVHDLGGSTFTAAVVRGLATVGQPVELDVGGADLDELVFDHVRAAAGDDRPTDPAALAGLRAACTAAKEALSADTEAEIPVGATRIRLTRAEFEELARPVLAETAVALRMAIEESGVTPATVLLAGGGAWLPLLTQVVSEELGRPVTATPPGAAAMGAALAAADTGRPATNPERLPRNHAGPRLAMSPEPAAFRAAPAGEVPTSLVEPVRPPVPSTNAPSPGRPRRTRTTAAAAAAGFVVVGAVAGIMLANGRTPPDAGAEPVPATSTVTSTVPLTTTTGAPPVTTTERQAPPQTERPAPPPTTSRTTPKTTTTTSRTSTTTVPTTTTTTSAPSSARTPDETARVASTAVPTPNTPAPDATKGGDE